MRVVAVFVAALEFIHPVKSILVYAIYLRSNICSCTVLRRRMRTMRMQVANYLALHSSID